MSLHNGGGFFGGHHSHQSAEPAGQSFESRNNMEPARPSALEQSNNNFRSWIDRSNTEHLSRAERRMRTEELRSGNEQNATGMTAPGVSGIGVSPAASGSEMVAAPHHHFLWFGSGHSHNNTANFPITPAASEPVAAGAAEHISGSRTHLPWISDEQPPADMHGVRPGIPPTNLHPVVPPAMHEIVPPQGLHAIVPPAGMDPYHYH
ncbi:MAG: hypothetical protein ACRD3W_00480, partial [Terriglobales bacterium]